MSENAYDRNCSRIRLCLTVLIGTVDSILFTFLVYIDRNFINLSEKKLFAKVLQFPRHRAKYKMLNTS